MSGFTCASCGVRHDGAPMSYRFGFPSEAFPGLTIRRYRDGELVAVADHRFVLANIELPVAGDPAGRFVWTCWMSLGQASFDRMQALWNAPDRQAQPPAFSYVLNAIPTYEPTTSSMIANVHARPRGERPWVELQPTDHPLAVEQRDGIGMERIAAIHHSFAHRAAGAESADARAPHDSIGSKLRRASQRFFR